MAGVVTGLARRKAPRAPMEELASAVIGVTTGVEGDYRGTRSVNRRVTVLAREAWAAAVAEAGGSLAATPWTARRANVCVEGIELPQARGARLRVGAALLEVTYETEPCHRMDEAWPGLRRALEPDWRGGVCCRVIEGGAVSVGDAVMDLSGRAGD